MPWSGIMLVVVAGALPVCAPRLEQPGLTQTVVGEFVPGHCASDDARRTANRVRPADRVERRTALAAKEEQP